MGDCDTMLSTVSFTSFMTCSISSWVLYFEKLKRRLQKASSSDRPMAFSTCEGSRSPDTQAEPEDIATWDSLVISSAERTCLNNTLLVLYKRGEVVAWICTSSISRRIDCSKKSLNDRILSFSPEAEAAALPNPTILATG